MKFSFDIHYSVFNIRYSLCVLEGCPIALLDPRMSPYTPFF